MNLRRLIWPRAEGKKRSKKVQFRSTRKKICISFDWHNDRNYRNLLSAWNSNANNPVDFDDLTPGAIDTNEVDRVKAVLTTKIRAASYTLVLVGEHANDFHKDRLKIGERNWIYWEIQKSKDEGNRLIFVKINSTYTTPAPLLSAGATRAMSFTLAAILKAINEA
jgi:hypothetical protein